MGGLLTVPQFLERFPEVDILDAAEFKDAWVTGMWIGLRMCMENAWRSGLMWNRSHCRCMAPGMCRLSNSNNLHWRLARTASNTALGYHTLDCWGDYTDEFIQLCAVPCWTCNRRVWYDISCSICLRALRTRSNKPDRQWLHYLHRSSLPS